MINKIKELENQIKEKKAEIRKLSRDVIIKELEENDKWISFNGYQKGAIIDKRTSDTVYITLIELNDEKCSDSMLEIRGDRLKSNITGIFKMACKVSMNINDITHMLIRAFGKNVVCRMGCMFKGEFYMAHIDGIDVKYVYSLKENEKDED